MPAEPVDAPPAAAGSDPPSDNFEAPRARRYQRPRIRKRVGVWSLLREREFRVLTITQFFSLAGDQLARVALSVLVFNRTNSPLQAAIAYALTFIPAAIGGPLLTGLADRRPRRSVMIASDLVRAPLIGLIAIPAIPLPLALVLLAVAGLFEAPFDAARGALLPDVLPGERYPAGYAFGQIIIQTAQVGGFGLAGLLLIALSPSILLIIDAATFVLSAVLIFRVINPRPAATGDPSTKPDPWWAHAFGDLKTSIQTVLGDRKLRPLALLAWSAASFSIGFEALAAPLSRASGTASWSVGILLASQPVGTVLGALLVTRIPSDRRPRAMGLLALLTVLPLVIGLARPPLAVLIVFGVASGLGMSFNVLASTAFVGEVAAEVRGRALGLVGTGLLVGQGIGVLVSGGLATAIDARIALGWIGVAGTGAVLTALIDGARSG